MSELLSSPKAALLKRVKEHLADHHALVVVQSGRDGSHRAIAECSCEIAREYRAVKHWVKARGC